MYDADSASHENPSGEAQSVLQSDCEIMSVLLTAARENEHSGFTIRYAPELSNSRPAIFRVTRYNGRKPIKKNSEN